MVKVSIIVPIYNAGIFLSHCIDTILTQHFHNFELLLIDDGSTDDSLTICTQYEVKDSRVRVFHKSNGGVSSARNLGLKEAKGEWIMFVDADDYIPSDSIKSLLSIEEVDLCVGGFKKNDEIHILKWKTNLINKENMYFFLSKNIDKEFFTNPWCKLFKNSIIKKHNLHFDENLHIGEDALFVLDYLAYCRKIYLSDTICYSYNGLTMDLFTSKYVKCKADIFYLCRNAFQKYEVLHLSKNRFLYLFFFDFMLRGIGLNKISPKDLSLYLSFDFVQESIAMNLSLNKRIVLFLTRHFTSALPFYARFLNFLRKK